MAQVGAGSTVTGLNNYRTSDFVLGTANQITTDPIILYSGTSEDLFANPAEGDLNFWDPDFAGLATAGDPRWKLVFISTASVSLNKTTLSLAVGASETLTATVLPADASNKKVTWSSSDAAVATVDAETGEVTAVAAGTATITATTVSGAKTATCEVTVTIPPTGVTLDEATLTLAAGATGTLVATVAPDNANNKNVTWSSSNTAVATVSTAGLVTAVAKGTATITATTVVGGFTATCEVTVTQPVTSVALNKPSTSIEVGATETLTVTVLPANADNAAVTWTSSAPAIASVNNGVVTAVAIGTATITVTSVDDPTKTATCAVTVTPKTNVEIGEVMFISAYPNPTDGLITLEFDKQKTYNVTITDMTGKVLLRQVIADQIGQLDISSYATGIYMLIIDDGKQKTTIRVVKN